MHAASLLPSLSLALPFTSTPLSLSPTPHFPSLCLFSLHQTIMLYLSLSLTHTQFQCINNNKQKAKEFLLDCPSAYLGKSSTTTTTKKVLYSDGIGMAYK